MAIENHIERRIADRKRLIDITAVDEHNTLSAKSPNKSKLRNPIPK